MPELLAIPYRSFHLAHARVSQQNYSLSGLVGCELKAKTVGVIGTGGIGSAACEILKVRRQLLQTLLDTQPLKAKRVTWSAFALYRLVVGGRVLPAIHAALLMQAHMPLYSSVSAAGLWLLPCAEVADREEACKARSHLCTAAPAWPSQ